MERQQRIEALFAGALERPPKERDDWLRSACGGDSTLLREIRSLVANHRENESHSWAAGAATQLIGLRDGLCGVRLGAYEILECIGIGGMGEVYRARDTKLNRDVALKFLPDEFAEDRGRLARFTREAQVLASLNHPNIAAIYGVEERALIMELVDGPTLAEHISRGPLAMEEALRITREIAEALECAHEKGIVHRDLKPANIKLTPEGRVKVLDFGLAKALATDAPGGGDLSLSPTQLVDATTTGMIMGTAAYMSPEQARGAVVDNRADIWSFGVVLYEILTGRQAFKDETIAGTLAAVLKTDPDWTALPTNTSAPIRRLLRRCIEKDRRRRLHNIGDAILEIDEALTGTVEMQQPAHTHVSRSVVPWAIAAFGAIAACIMAVWTWRHTAAPPSRPVVRWATILSHAATSPGTTANPALSPDGSHLAYYGATLHFGQIYIRSLDQLEATAVTGSDAVDYMPFIYSPDGRWIAYQAIGKWKKVPTAGGTPITLADESYAFGATWGPDDSVILGRSSGGLSRIRSAGGPPETLTTADPRKGELLHAWPQFLPDGKIVLFSVRTSQSWDDARIEMLNLRNGERRVLVQGGTNPRYAASGHLVFERGSSLYAVAFDLDKLQVHGTPIAVVQGIHAQPGSGFALYSFSGAGDLVYVPGSGHSENRLLVWVDGKGTVESLPAPPRSYSNPAISPDGRRIAVNIASGADGHWDVWIYEIQRRTLTRLTFDGTNIAPLWTPDSKYVTFRRIDPEGSGIFRIAADGGSPEPLSITAMPSTPTSWTPDGHTLLFYRGNPLSTEIWTLPYRAGPSAVAPQPRPLIRPRAATPQLSPDGRWIAYSSSESGTIQIYVQPFPMTGAKWQISTEGGSSPRWSPNGRALFYRSGDQMMAVDIEAGPNFRWSTPRVLFTGAFEGPPQGLQPGIGYDVSRDGKRLLMVKAGTEQDAAGQIVVVHNWFEELRERVPVGK